MAHIEIYPVNALSLEEEMFFKQGKYETNSTFVWTGNLGVVVKNSWKEWRPSTLAVKEELEAALSALFGLKITVSDFLSPEG